MISKRIKVGIVGYGNLGRGVEAAIKQNPDMELLAVFTRRDPESVEINTPGVRVFNVDDALAMKGKIDVMILCGGSAKDLPEQGPSFAKDFNTVDSFDTHAKIPEYFEAVDKAAKAGGKASIISVGWDPGLFSIYRMISGAILPDGEDHTFWGKGISQGHSDAIRRVKGVKDGRQYTIPMERAMEAARAGKENSLTARDKHLRECFVVAEEGADKAAIEEEIKTMPNYFADYETVVHFITAEELREKHAGMPHGGIVIRTGETNQGANKQLMEFSLKLGNNPEFTGSVLVAYARAAMRLSSEGKFGAFSVFDIPLAYLSPKSGADLRKELL